MDVAFITCLIIQQTVIFWGSVPVPLLFTRWNRVNLLLRHQFHTTDIKPGDNKLPKGSETLNLSSKYLNAVERGT